jgi:hypothetical protein
MGLLVCYSHRLYIAAFLLLSRFSLASWFCQVLFLRRAFSARVHHMHVCLCTCTHAPPSRPYSSYTVLSLMHVWSSMCTSHARVPMHMYIYAPPPRPYFSYTVPSLHVWSSICFSDARVPMHMYILHICTFLGRALLTPCLLCTCAHPCASHARVPMHMYLYAPPPRLYSSYAVLSLHVCITCMCTYPHVHRHRLLGRILLMPCFLCTCGHPYASPAHICVHTCIRAMCLSAP